MSSGDILSDSLAPLHFLKKRARPKRSSRYARFIPKHMRVPPPKGTYVFFCAGVRFPSAMEGSLTSRKRSGSNLSGSVQMIGS
ncbi:hypothetical protein Tdes44962_MAKER01106 [Teratosphaeria destructans]|uniref:Uncharacterized protein n=1 Tax=Teratosphaeria destructans TaxID=418781 RepID=A0A9W7SIB8_9PEZI|nr:hypothetical protein Tdes44962_MAKER01106 [Teratosphaeria destructans]